MTLIGDKVFIEIIKLKGIIRVGPHPIYYMSSKEKFGSAERHTNRIMPCKNEDRVGMMHPEIEECQRVLARKRHGIGSPSEGTNPVGILILDLE